MSPGKSEQKTNDTVVKPWHDESLTKSAVRHFEQLRDLGLLSDVERCRNHADQSDIDAAYAALEFAGEKNKCYSLVSAVKAKTVPIVQSNSLTAALNESLDKYALRIRDIALLKRGDKLDVLLLHRNIGDAVDGAPSGQRRHTIPLSTRLGELESDILPATYTHGYGLTGTLELHYLHTFENWTWEINGTVVNDSFWRPICDDDGECIDWRLLDQNVKIGYRGPAIAAQHADKLPKYYTHYDTWWNDYVPYIHSDMTHLAHNRPPDKPSGNVRDNHKTPFEQKIEQKF